MAISGVMSVSLPTISYMISPQAAASASRHVRSAKNSWDPWWSMARQMSFLYGTAFSGSRLGAAMSTDTTAPGIKPFGAHSPSA